MGGGAWGGILKLKSQSAKICLNFNFRGGGGGPGCVFRSKLWSGKFGPKFTVRPETCLCITVVSHILRMWRLIKSISQGIYFETRIKVPSLSVANPRGLQGRALTSSCQFFSFSCSFRKTFCKIISSRTSLGSWRP